MPRPSRPLPYVGMPVRIEHFGASEPAVIEYVGEQGRVLLVGGESYTLRRLTGHFVREGEPYYGTRLVLDTEA